MELSGDSQKDKKQPTWWTFISKTRPSQIYYYNVQTGESTWNVNHAKDYLKLQQPKAKQRPLTPDGVPNETVPLPPNFDHTRPPPNFDPAYSAPDGFFPAYGPGVFNPSAIPAGLNLIQLEPAARVMNFNRLPDSLPNVMFSAWNANVHSGDWWGSSARPGEPHDAFRDAEMAEADVQAAPHVDLRLKLREKDMMRSYSEVSSEPDESVQSTQSVDQFKSHVRSNARFANHKITIDEAKLLLEKDFSASENPEYKDLELVIVLDTNMLMHNIQFVSILRLAVYEVTRKARIIVPFRVLRELNNLKVENPLARKANNFLNVHLNKDVKFKGQSNYDAKQIVDELQGKDCEFADIHILNCCIQLARGNHRVILLTNDVSLCNIASSNGIDALQYVQVVKLVLECKKLSFNRTGRIRLKSPDIFTSRETQEESIVHKMGLYKSKSISNLLQIDSFEKNFDCPSSSSTVPCRFRDDVPSNAGAFQKRIAYDGGDGARQNGNVAVASRRRHVSVSELEANADAAAIAQRRNPRERIVYDGSDGDRQKEKVAVAEADVARVPQEPKTPRKRITYSDGDQAESKTVKNGAGAECNLPKTPRKRITYSNDGDTARNESESKTPKKIININANPNHSLPKTPHKRIEIGMSRNDGNTTINLIPVLKITFNNDRQEPTAATTSLSANPILNRSNISPPKVLTGNTDVQSNRSNKTNSVKVDNHLIKQVSPISARKRITFDVNDESTNTRLKIKSVRRQNANDTESTSTVNSRDGGRRADASDAPGRPGPSSRDGGQSDGRFDERLDERLGFINELARVHDEESDGGNVVSARTKTIKDAIKDCQVNADTPPPANVSETDDADTLSVEQLNEDDIELRKLRKFIKASSPRMHKLEWLWVIRQKMEDVLKSVLENHIDKVPADKIIPQPWSLSEILTLLELIFPSKNSTNVTEIMLWNSIKQLNQVVKDRIEVERPSNKKWDLPMTIIGSFYELSYKVAKRLKGIEKDGYTTNKLLEVMNTICDLDSIVDANVLSGIPLSADGIPNYKGHPRIWDPCDFRRAKEKANGTNELVQKAPPADAEPPPAAPRPEAPPPPSADAEGGARGAPPRTAGPVFKLKCAGRPYRIERPARAKKVPERRTPINFKDLTLKRTIVNDCTDQTGNTRNAEETTAAPIVEEKNPTVKNSNRCSDIIEALKDSIKDNPKIRTVLTDIFRKLYMILEATKHKCGENVPVEDNRYDANSLEEMVAIYEGLSGSVEGFYTVLRAVIFDQKICRCMSKRFMKAVKVLSADSNTDCSELIFADFLGHMLYDVCAVGGYAYYFIPVKNTLRSYSNEYRQKMKCQDEQD